ncbi:uncharacterized protein LOC122391701 [Amphibalanus amphitrite]|uniref:uncharacterized protein LOC122391701 n=1 Tax=Amphibalanus amphitrite TaxID=1232801 RepID=UPI001C91A69C|nr:uncharacterized protein LOC122391701 [Amphibalanus amphitrite]
MAIKKCSGSRVWRVAAIVLRVVCFILLLVMFSFKLADFMHRPVVWETRVVDAAPPSITICPSRLNVSSLEDARSGWERGSFTTEEVLQRAATPVEAIVIACSTANGEVCTPGGKQQNVPAICSAGTFPWDSSTAHYCNASRENSDSGGSRSGFKARWLTRRLPPGFTCHTLHLQQDDDAPVVEILLTLALHPDLFHTVEGFYRLFFHHGRSPKVWNGGAQISPYHLVQGGLFQEVLLTQIGMTMVDRPRQHCRPEEDYDVNQCLLDCRSLAAFTESNCSVQWGATSGGGLPACVSRAEYEAAVRAWQRARPDCDHCLRPCQTQLIEVKSPPAIQGNASSAIDIKLRFSPERLSVRQRLAYELVDLLSDLGGAFGLLLGYSLMSLVDLLDAAVGWNERRRRRRAAPEGWR